MAEFDLINRIFKASAYSRDADVVMGIGDDAAVLRVPAGHELLVSTDTLVCGTHFHAHMAPHAVGHKSLAVNLSDMAAMGATPAWATLAITHPDGDEAWLQAFATGFADLARQHKVELVGGDTTSGPLSITITIMGYAKPNHVVYRDGAQAGDVIGVTGYLGLAAAELRRVLAGMPSEPISPLTYPDPRVAFMQRAAPHMHAAIDISDGLAADLGHILHASGMGAHLDLGNLPLPDDEMLSDSELAIHDALYGGDDYEIVFTCSEDQFERIAMLQQCPISRIGTIVPQCGLRARRDSTDDYSDLPVKGYQHFG